MPRFHEYRVEVAPEKVVHVSFSPTIGKPAIFVVAARGGKPFGAELIEALPIGFLAVTRQRSRCPASATPGL